MPQRTWRDDEEDWSETGGDDYGDDDRDGDDSDDSLTCPGCGADIYADLEHCPRCGHWLTHTDLDAHRTGLFASRNVRLIALALLVIFLGSLLAEIFLMR